MSAKASALGAAMLLCSAALALAQTAAPTATTTGSPETTPNISPSSPQAGNPGVNPNAAGTQTGTSGGSGTGAPGYGSSGNATGPAAPNAAAGQPTLQAGANSFTEAQARRRMRDHGYTQITKMHKDQNSIWQAIAMKGGRQVRVGLDFRGTVAEEP